MQTIRCTGRQIATISEQVKADDQEFVLTQMEESNKLAFLPLEEHSQSGTVYDPQGNEHPDLWATGQRGRAATS